MPNIGDIAQEVNINSFQYMSGDNQTLAIYGVNYQAGKKVSLFAGGGYNTNFKDNTGLVFEAKGKYQFDNNHSLQLRVRSCHSDKINTTQFRVSPGWKEKIGKTTSIYVNPYYSYKVNYDSGKGSHDLGIFAGVSQKLSKNVSAFIEGQRYKLQNYENNDADKYSINAGLSVNF